MAILLDFDVKVFNLLSRYKQAPIFLRFLNNENLKDFVFKFELPYLFMAYAFCSLMPNRKQTQKTKMQEYMRNILKVESPIYFRGNYNIRIMIMLLDWARTSRVV